jgi:prepilin-type N-terminal cleavage/methylation domain-containing protein
MGILRGKKMAIKRGKNQQRGTSLIEILVAVAIFAVAMSGLLGSIFAVVYLSETSRNLTIATSDLNNIMERVRATPFDHLAQDFPQAVTDGPAANRYPAIIGGYRLNNQHITVTYANPAGDPREVKTTITWEDKKGRPYTASFSTYRTNN